MRMHAQRRTQRTRAAARAARFHGDECANFASAALPLVFGTLGMALVGVGAVLMVLPLVMTGIGLAVLAFAVYLIAAGMDRQDARRRPARPERVAPAAAEPVTPTPPRSPLADHAVAALTGAGGPGNWPPLPSASAGATAPRAAPTAPVGVWAPGARVAPAGWDRDEVVEFESAPQRLAPQAVAHDGGLSFVEGTVDPDPDELPAARPRVRSATPEPDGDGRDFRIWPGAKDVDSWATFTGERRPRPSRYTEEQMKEAMDARRRDIADRLPTVGAILQDVAMRETELERLRREATRGKCSQCAAVIWAPKKRPIVLKCPGCGHKAKLY